MPRLAPAVVAFLLSSALVLLAWTKRPAPRTMISLTPEAAAYRDTCGKCHPPFDPTTHRKEEWRGVVNSMHQRMADRALDVAPETLELAIRHLEANGR